VAFFILAVGETILLEKPTGAATAHFIPFWSLVDVLAHKVDGPSLRG